MRNFCCICCHGRTSKSKLNQDCIQVESRSPLANSHLADTKEEREISNTRAMTSGKGTNIIANHDFSRDLEYWSPNCCRAYVSTGDSTSGEQADFQHIIAVVTDRKETWQGLEQDVTSKLSPGVVYAVSATVGVSRSSDHISDVIATLKLESSPNSTNYMFIGRTSVSPGNWETLEGTFTLSSIPSRAVFYLEGPPPGVDLLIRSVTITFPSLELQPNSGQEDSDNIILNPSFYDGLNNWSGRGCVIDLRSSMTDGTSKPFASATERTHSWNGIQQDVTGRISRKLAYSVAASVRISNNNGATAEVRATLWIQKADDREEYVGIGKVQAADTEWKLLEGKFLINGFPKKVLIYLEGPPAGTDIYVNNVKVIHASKPPTPSPPVIDNPGFNVNIIQNSDLLDGANRWFPLGNCRLSVSTGAPKLLPPIARKTLGEHAPPLSGWCILVTNRSQNWMGPGQIITENIKLFLTYQVSAWVKIGGGATGRQNVNVALAVDDQWINGGQVEISDNGWHEVAGSFRIEKNPSKVMAYVQGPDSGVDLMVAALQIFPVDREARFRLLKHRTEKIRKRDVTLKFKNSAGSFVRIEQTKSSFPFGCCLNRTNLDNEDFVDFFLKNFNWSVFGNELKWYWTEPQRGNLNYRDADEMVDFCERNGVKMRGHCIFWEVDSTVQPWIKSLSSSELQMAVQGRLQGLLTRYKGRFKHYDVDNEMLHGSFFQDRLGTDARPWMFKKARELVPDAALFVNDYHVEDGCDARSSPRKYVAQVLDLQGRGASVGGVGVQGHIDSPVGEIVCAALDELAVLGVPVWLTELDVSSENEYVRADDLEVMMREAFAHPAVEGVVLWGCWELFMSRENSHLVDAEGEVNEAGRRYLRLRDEWRTSFAGHVDEDGMVCFRAYHGSYQVEILSPLRSAVRTTIDVDDGSSPLVISLDL